MLNSSSKGGSVFTAKVIVSGHVAAMLPAEKREFYINYQQPTAISDIREIMNLRGMYATIIVDGKRVDENFILMGNAAITLISPAGGG